MKTFYHFSITACLSFLFIFSTIAQTPNSAYTVQAGDWLSKIAEKAYNNPHLYYQIVTGTNAKATTNDSFQRISSVNKLQVGQQVWIPALETAAALSDVAIKPTTSSDLTGVPKTNCEIRLWYNFQVVAIGKINEKWEQDGIDLETRAKKAFEMRHEARVNARFMMQNPLEVKGLQARDLVKYGNPNGPTFEYLVKKNTDKGASLAEAYQSIIASSSRTDSKYNADCQ